MTTGQTNRDAGAPAIQDKQERLFNPALASLSMSMLLSSMSTSITNVALPTLAKVFGASFQDVQWVVLSYLLAITTLIVSAGRLGDLWGRKRLLTWGVGLFAFASFLCGSAPDLITLIGTRIAQGLGAAVMMALTMAFVGETVPKSKTGSAMGLLGTMSAVGTAIGPTLGGAIVSQLGWRAIFFVKVPLALLALYLLLRHLPADRPKSGQESVRFDAVGTLLLAATLACYALSMTLGRGHFGELNAALLAAALVILAVFVWVEKDMKSPLIKLAMFKDRAISGGVASSALVTTVVMSTLVVGPFYLSGALGLDSAGIGLVMSSGPIMAAITGVPAGRIADRFGPARVTQGGLILMVLGTALMSALPTSLGIPGYVLPLMIITAGYALFQAANNTVVMTGVAQELRGVVSGLLNLSRNLGLVTGASVMGAVFALAAGGDAARASHDATIHGMKTSFGLAVVLVVIALIIVCMPGQGKRKT